MRLADRLRRALAEGPLGLPGSNRYQAPGIDHSDPVPAAVLVAITDRPEPGVLLTLRTSNLRRHAGQVAFPGGRIDPEDEDAIAAALREAHEEIALPPDAAEIVGTTEPYQTGTGYRITPVIAVIPPDLSLHANADEVELLFETPLDFLFDPANHLPRTVVWEGIERHYVEILWEDQRIWGATAAMIVNLAHRLRAPA